MNKSLRAIVPIVAVAMGLVLSSLVALLADESPLHVMTILFHSSFGSLYDFGMTLFYATPLIFTGLAVAIPFRAGLFNIGAEGQLSMGAFAAAAAGAMAPHLLFPFSIIIATVAAFAGGAAWGAIAGWARAYRGTHEVIATILLNFIAAALVSWLTLYVLKNPESQNPETIPLTESYLIQQWPIFEGAPLGSSFIFAVIVAVLMWVVVSKMRFGFRLLAVGQNQSAAKFSGIHSARTQFLSFVLGGGLAGLVALPEVLGNSGRFRLGFSSGYGFTGIAVALLVNAHPVYIIGAAILFGGLHKGTLDLDLSTDRLTRDVSMIMQAIMILVVAAARIAVDAIERKQKNKLKSAPPSEVKG